MGSWHRSRRVRLGARVPEYLAGLLLGVVFTANGQLSFERVRSFGFLDRLGDTPVAGLVEGGDGWFYGTTIFGGASDKGTAFKIRKDGTGYVTLHQFTGANGDGSQPAAGLILGSDGALYGTTFSGGNGNAGTVFKLNRDGAGYAVVRSLDPSTDGANPQSYLLEGSDGRIYGTARSGGTGGFGTLFRLQKSGADFEVLHTFSGGDGKNPFAGLTEASDGGSYGTTFAGGNADAGVVFKINRDGSGFALVHSFATATDGQGPSASLIEGNDGALYGTARSGGSSGSGTIFKVNRDATGFSV